MRFVIRALILVLASAWLTACGWMQPQESLDKQQDVRNTLMEQYDEWKNVRYRAGGLSKRGVDCSGFVYLTFQEEFGIKLPRSSTEQVRMGRSISQRDLTPGDLVFFKTGRSQRHVGIYLEGRKFLHASTERGVMISSLDDRYWSRAYWTSVRVLI